MNKILAVALTILLATTSCVHNSYGENPFINNETNVSHLQNSVVAILRVNGTTGALEGPTCTAFFVSQTLLATAFHCVHNPRIQRIEILPGLFFDIQVDDPASAVGSEVVIMTNQHYREYMARDDNLVNYHATTVVAIDQEHDVALLRLPGNITTSNYLRIESDDLIVGERVYTMAMPASQPWILTQGIISALHPVNVNSGNILHQATIAPGASGSPLINNYGEVIGVDVGIIVNATYLGVATPIHYIQRLIDTL